MAHRIRTYRFGLGSGGQHLPHALDRRFVTCGCRFPREQGYLHRLRDGDGVVLPHHKCGEGDQRNGRDRQERHEACANGAEEPPSARKRPPYGSRPHPHLLLLLLLSLVLLLLALSIFFNQAQ